MNSQGTPAFYQVASGLAKPVAIANANDGSNRLFICENKGTIKILADFVNGTVGSTDFLDIASKVDNGNGEQGLLGLAFHPKFPDSNYFYVNYIIDGAGASLDTTRIARFSVNPLDSNLALTNSEKIIIQYSQDYSNHNGGDLQFGSDGYLYISSGDGGSGDDPKNRSQDTTSLLGKILRLDIDSDQFPYDNRKYYSIPMDNPFAHSAGADEIWSYGWRNPWRFSFDAESNIMFVGDVGQDTREEISIDSMIYAGNNYGWRCKEGNYDTGLTGCLSTPITDPIFEMHHAPSSSICSVTGGYVYRGSAFPSFNGWYFSIDYCSADLFMLDTENNYDSTHFYMSGLNQVTTFGVSENNELYAARLNGRIYRIIDSDHCLDDIIINTIDTSFYSVENSITSEAVLYAMDTVSFSAGEAINLEIGFEIKQMSTFSAENISCLQHIINADGK